MPASIFFSYLRFINKIFTPKQVVLLQILFEVLAKKYNVNTGYQRFNKPLLVSYPRSGTNWVRYMVEFLTGKPTPGENRLVRGNKLYNRIFNGDFVIDRAHNGQNILAKYPKVLLIVRNYKECLIRQFKHKWANYQNIEAFIKDESLHTPCSWYIKNIEAFEEYSGEKKLLYFEDMIQNPTDFIDEFVEFLDLPIEKLADLKQNLTEHQKKSVALYTKRGKSSFTDGKKENLKLHSSSLSKAQLLEFDEYYIKNHFELFNSYLRRYAEK